MRSEQGFNFVGTLPFFVPATPRANAWDNKLMHGGNREISFQARGDWNYAIDIRPTYAYFHQLFVARGTVSRGESGCFLEVLFGWIP